MGKMLLAGGSEFCGRMAEPDRLALAMTGKSDPSVVIIPTAAAPDNNHARAGNNGVGWFSSLGVKRVKSLPVIDRDSADDHRLAHMIIRADLVYILGGFPGFLAETLRNTRCQSAILDGHRRGSVLCGSSAGAMVLCEWFVNPETGTLQAGFGLLSNLVIIPHHGKVGKEWVSIIFKKLPDVMIAGIDEQTAMVRKKPGVQWCVRGQGAATIYVNNSIKTYSDQGPCFELPAVG